VLRLEMRLFPVRVWGRDVAAPQIGVPSVGYIGVVDVLVDRTARRWQPDGRVTDRRDKAVGEPMSVQNPDCRSRK